MNERKPSLREREAGKVLPRRRPAVKFDNPSDSLQNPPYAAPAVYHF